MSEDDSQDLYSGDVSDNGEVEEKGEMEEGFDDDDADYKDAE